MIVFFIFVFRKTVNLGFRYLTKINNKSSIVCLEKNAYIHDLNGCG